jgi:NADH:ubiquinone oxidoreductase subunit E
VVDYLGFRDSAIKLNVTMAIKVHVCTGPTCGPFGCKEILNSLRRLPPRDRKHIEIITHHCYARCQLPEPVCPCVRINDTWIERADVRTVKAQLESLLAGLSEQSESNDPFAKYCG